MIKNSDLPAMPILGDTEAFIEFLQGVKGGNNYGLTKREHIATAVMQGMMSSEVYGVLFRKLSPEELLKHVSVMCIQHADALLAELEKDNAN